MRKWIIGAAVCAMAGLVFAAGRPGLVKTKNGTLYDGTIEEKEGGISVNVRGIETVVPRDQVESITYGDFKTRWTEAYDKLAADDAKGRVAAGRRAFDERMYDLAEKAARDAQTVDPNSAEAAELLRLTQTQRRLERNSTANPDNGGPARPQQPAVKPAGQWTLLTPEQINRVKQTEFKATDSKLRVNFKNNVRKKFYDASPNLDISYADFLKLPQAEQADRILRSGAPELAKDVEINNDPESILLFRRDVLPLVTQNCATSGCHGGPNAEASKFALVAPATDNASVYTNFYVLKMKSMPVETNGELGKPNRAAMIDRNRADDSLLIQYGLPETNATFKHPQVASFVPLFRNGPSDPRITPVRSFIAALNPIESDAGIDFKLQRQDPQAK